MNNERPKKRAKDKRTSDAPVDLTKEREAFVRTFLRKGVELTEDLLRENDVLQSQLSSLQIENARLRAQVASDDAIRELLRTVEALEQEKKELMQRSRELEQAKLNALLVQETWRKLMRTMKVSGHRQVRDR